ncbi:MAG TPA: ABC transporter permease [Vicinamibacterales bacterium]|jgi:predicted permease
MSWRRFFRRSRWDEERARELESYLQIETDAQIARGLSPEDARAAARRKLGNATRIREEIYAMNTIGWLETLWQDLRYGARLLRLNPGFATVAILSLALGVGANAAIFQLIDTVRLRTLPVSHPEQLVEIQIGSTHRTGSFTGRRPMLTYPLLEAIRRDQQAFSGLAVWSAAQFDLSQGGEAQNVQALYVNGDFFPTLGVEPIAGRLFVPSDDVRGCGAPGVVISSPFWQRQYGGAASVIGQTLTLDGHAFDILGVTPAAFFGVDVGRSFDVAVPLCADSIIRAEKGRLDGRASWWLAVLGRLKPGWSATRATAQLAAISPGLFRATLPEQYGPDDAKGYLAMKLAAEPAPAGTSALRRRYDTPLWLLLGATALLLLITCANLANLLLARATAREREIAVRLALGASRTRIVRQLLAESLLIACAGTVFGALVADWLSRFIVGLLSTETSQIFLDFHLDWRVFALMSGLAVVTALLFGLAPALRATQTAPAEVMKTGGRSATDTHERFSLRRALVVAQVALSLVLVLGALLFARTLQNLATIDPGFQPAGLVSINLDLRRTAIPAADLAAAKTRLTERVRALPGVTSAAEARIVPFDGNFWNELIVINGIQQPGIPYFNRVGPDYFRTIGTKLVRGRDFSAHDTASSPAVAIVSQSFVRKYLGNGDPIGRAFRIRMPPGQTSPNYQVIGVVEDTKYQSVRDPFGPLVFTAAAQDPAPDAFGTAVVRSNLPLATLASEATTAITGIDPAAVVQFEPVEQDLYSLLLPERLMATLSVFFGLLAALLATIGLYGVLSYMVARRRNEIGIRMTLGASTRTVIRLILGEASLLVTVGLAIGVVLAVASGRAANALLYGLRASDPLTMGLAAALLVTVAALASWIPAMRAARVDPNVALREE